LREGTISLEGVRDSAIKLSGVKEADQLSGLPIPRWSEIEILNHFFERMVESLLYILDLVLIRYMYVDFLLRLTSR